MNRIAARAWIVLILVLTLAAGTVFFFCEYLAKSDDWILFSGSPHLYNSGKVGTGTITDRDGQLLTDLTDGRTYSEDETVRTATLHWVGDRLGNIAVPFVTHYSRQLLGYDSVNGIYAYGSSSGNIRLTLSAKVQAAALEAMGDRVGTVAVYNYKTGELICAVTTPTYDPDNVPDIAGDTEGKYTGVYVNRFLQSKYIPGSIFKIVTLAAALETVPDIQEQTFTCTGVYEIGGGDVTCESTHGKQTLKEAFCNSCNCAFAQITGLVGQEKLARYIELFGVVDNVQFDGITTVSGNFDISDATAQQFAWSGIGQHKDQVNPCAFLSFVGAIAGDGVGAQPYVVQKITVGRSTTYKAQSQQRQRIISTETARIIREYMANNVTTKYGADHFPEMTVCAKSGTGEVGGGKKPNAMFTGFVADEDCPLAFFVAIEEGGYGASTCVPVLSKVLEACRNELDLG